MRSCYSFLLNINDISNSWVKVHLIVQLHVLHKGHDKAIQTISTYGCFTKNVYVQRQDMSEELDSKVFLRSNQGMTHPFGKLFIINLIFGQFAEISWTRFDSIFDEKRTWTKEKANEIYNLLPQAEHQ